MTVTVEYAEEDYRRLAAEHYASKESRASWRALQHRWALTVAAFLTSLLFTVRGIPTLTAIAIAALAAVAAFFLVGLVYPLYVRRETTKYLADCAPMRFSVIVGHAGIQHIDGDDIVTYSGTSVRAADEGADGSVLLKILDGEIYLPASAFPSDAARAAFLAAIAAVRVGGTPAATGQSAIWWTQSGVAESESPSLGRSAP